MHNRLAQGEWLITVVDRDDEHHYQPGYLFVPFGAYIGATYWFSSSTSFANPAVTIGRMFSDTFAGIAPGSAPGFVLAQ